MKTVLAGFFTLCSAAAWAQAGEFWIGAGASVLANTNIGTPVPGGEPSDVKLGDGFRVNFRYAFNSSGHFGHELQYAYNRTTLTDNTGDILGGPGSAACSITCMRRRKT